MWLSLRLSRAKKTGSKVELKKVRGPWTRLFDLSMVMAIISCICVSWKSSVGYHVLCDAVASDKSLKDAGVLEGRSDMTLLTIIEIILMADRGLAWRANHTEGYTPLHKAFENGNIEVALWIMYIVKSMGEQQGWSLNDLLNLMDNVSNSHNSWLISV